MIPGMPPGRGEISSNQQKLLVILLHREPDFDVINTGINLEEVHLNHVR